MRSRYSAYVVHNADYLRQTWHSNPRPGRIDFDADQRWTGLEIVATTEGGMLDPSGTVEFRAGYTRRGVPGVQHELSRFVRESGQWVYLGEAEV
jgi:SEC-C motif-containing protein